MNIKNKYKGIVTKANGKNEYFFGPTVNETTEMCRISGMVSYQVIDRETGWTVASRRPIVRGNVEGEYNPHSLRNIYLEHPLYGEKQSPAV